MYDLISYGRMIADKHRIEAYTAALRQTLTTDSIVLDIGTGTGVFAMLACKFGASHVYAIEPDDVIEVARSVADANGFKDRITFIQGLSTEIILPERVDVVIADLRGVLPYFRNNISTLIDARERLLSSSGTLIPQRDSLWVAVVDAEELYGKWVETWNTHSQGLDWQLARHRAVNQWGRGRVRQEQVILNAQEWAVLDYTSLKDTNVKGSVIWTVDFPRRAHGLSVWFETELAAGIGFSNAPTETGTVHGSAFFPFENPIELLKGDIVTVTLQANQIGEDYCWQWQTKVQTKDQIRVNFRQSTFYSVSQSLARLHKRGADYKPMLNQDGQLDAEIISLMDGTNTLSEIADLIYKRTSEHCKTYEKLYERVCELSVTYT